MSKLKGSVTMDANPTGKNQYTSGANAVGSKAKTPVGRQKPAAERTPAERMTKHLEKKWDQDRGDFVKHATSKLGATEEEAHEHFNKFNRLKPGTR